MKNNNMHLGGRNVYVDKIKNGRKKIKERAMSHWRRGDRSVISQKAYRKGHPRPVTNPTLTPWVLERKERRAAHRDARARKEKAVG